jgi:hypothetical protein
VRCSSLGAHTVRHATRCDFVLSLSVSNISPVKQHLVMLVTEATIHLETTCLLSEGGRSASNGEVSVLLGDDLSGSDQGEAQVLAQVLVGVVSLDLRVLDGGGLDDLDVASHSSVSTSHVVVHLTDGTSESDISVLLVHVVGTASASVAQPDSEVLDLSGVLLEDLSDIEDLTTGSLGLSQRFHVVPELGLRDNFVAGEDLHSVDLRARVLGSGSSTTNKLVEVHLRCNINPGNAE